METGCAPIVTAKSAANLGEFCVFRARQCQSLNLKRVLRLIRIKRLRARCAANTCIFARWTGYWLPTTNLACQRRPRLSLQKNGRSEGREFDVREKRSNCPIRVFSSLTMLLGDGSGYCGACRARVHPYKTEQPTPEHLTMTQVQSVVAQTTTKKRATKKGK